MEFALNTGVLSTADDGLRGCSSSPSSLPFSSTNQLTLAAKSACHMLRPHPQSDLLEHLAMINPFYLQQFQVSSMLGERKSADAQHHPSRSPLATNDMNSVREVFLEDLVILYRLINGEASGRRIGVWGLFCGFCRDVLRDRIQQEKLKRGEKQDEGGEGKKNESCPSSRNMQTRGATKISKREREAKKERERKFVLEILQQMEDEGNHHMNTTNTDGDQIPSLSSRDTPGKERKVHHDDNQTSSTLVNGKTASRTTGRRHHHVPLLQQLQLRFAIAVGALDHQLGVLRLPSSSYSAGTERSLLTGDGGERNDGVFSSERGLHPDDDVDSAGEERDEEEEGRDEKENEEGMENKEDGEAGTGRKTSEKKDRKVPGGRRGRGLASRSRQRNREQEGGGEGCSSEEEGNDEKDEGGEVEEELRRMRDLLYGVYAQRTQFGVVYVPEQKGEDEKDAKEDWEDEGDDWDDGGTSRKRRRKHTNKTKRRGRKSREERSRD